MSVFIRAKLLTHRRAHLRASEFIKLLESANVSVPARTEINGESKKVSRKSIEVCVRAGCPTGSRLIEHATASDFSRTIVASDWLVWRFVSRRLFLSFRQRKHNRAPNEDRT